MTRRCLIAAVLVVLSVPALATSITAGPPILVVGENASYTTTLVASSSSGGSIQISNCPVSPVPSGDLVAGGTLFIEQLGGQLCLPSNGLGWLPIITTGDVSPLTVLRFNDRVTRAEFSVPPLTAALVTDTEVGEIARAANNGPDGCFIVFVNTGDEDGAVTLTIHDAQNNVVGTEYAAVPRGVSGYTVSTPFVAGRITIREGYVNVGPSQPVTVIYAFAAIGPRDGHTQRIETMTVQ